MCSSSRDSLGEDRKILWSDQKGCIGCTTWLSKVPGGGVSLSAFDPYVYHHVQRYLAHSNIVCLLFGILLCQTRPSQFVVSTYSSVPTGFGRCISYHSSAGLHVAFNECNKTDNPMKTKARSCHTAYLQPPSTEDSSMIEGDTKFANAEELKEWLLGQGVDEDDVVEAVDRLFAMKFNRPSRLFGITVRRSEEAHLH